jgi:hypothetical protein
VFRNTQIFKVLQGFDNEQNHSYSDYFPQIPSSSRQIANHQAYEQIHQGINPGAKDKSGFPGLSEAIL